MTTFVSSNDFNFRLITPLNVAAKIMGIDWNFHVNTIFPVGTMARSERKGYQLADKHRGVAKALK